MSTFPKHLWAAAPIFVATMLSAAIGYVNGALLPWPQAVLLSIVIVVPVAALCGVWAALRLIELKDPR